MTVTDERWLGKMAHPLSESHRRQKLRRAAWGGGKARVPTRTAWAHIDRLCAEGWTMARVAKAAGLDVQLVHQRCATMHKAKVARILMVNRAVLYATAEDDDYVPAIGARRRIQALHAIGWKGTDIMARSSTASRAAKPDRLFVTAHTWRTIRDAYDRLSMNPGTSTQTLNRARRAGWPPPLCWDDDDIDDPRAEPTGRRRPKDDRTGPHAELLEQVQELTARGLSANSIAVLLDVSQRTIQRCRGELADMDGWEDVG